MEKEKVTVKDFVKKHKTEIKIGAVMIATAAIGYKAGYTKGWLDYSRLEAKHGLRMKDFLNGDIVNMPGFVIKGGLTVGDLGKLGKEFMKHDDGLTKHTEILEIGSFRFE